MDQTPHWTPRAEKRLIGAMTYIALNFYPEYAVAFRNDVIETANGIPANPKIGPEAFPGQGFPDRRKVLCKNKNWWVFYRIKRNHIDIISVKHVLQQVQTPHSL